MVTGEHPLPRLSCLLDFTRSSRENEAVFCVNRVFYCQEAQSYLCLQEPFNISLERTLKTIQPVHALHQPVLDTKNCRSHYLE